MKKLDSEATVILNKIKKISAQTGLSFDKPGTPNWRRRKGVYSIYLRATTEKGRQLLEKVWLSKSKNTTGLYKQLATEFSQIEIAGGCSDMGCSIKVRALADNSNRL